MTQGTPLCEPGHFGQHFLPAPPRRHASKACGTLAAYWRLAKRALPQCAHFRVAQAMDTTLRNPLTETQVLIVGAGPVGLTLALDLGRRGVRCTLIERNETSIQLPKMERCNARTMEIYRRLGVAERVRDAGLPRDAPMDVFLARIDGRPGDRASCRIRRSPPPRRKSPRTTTASPSSPISSSRSTRSSRCCAPSSSRCRTSPCASAAS